MKVIPVFTDLATKSIPRLCFHSKWTNSKQGSSISFVLFFFLFFFLGVFYIRAQHSSPFISQKALLNHQALVKYSYKEALLLITTAPASPFPPNTVLYKHTAVQWQGTKAGIPGQKCVTYRCFSLQESQGYVYWNAWIGEYCRGLSVCRHVTADICNVNKQRQKGCSSISHPRLCCTLHYS